MWVLDENQARQPRVARGGQSEEIHCAKAIEVSNTCQRWVMRQLIVVFLMLFVPFAWATPQRAGGWKLGSGSPKGTAVIYRSNPEGKLQIVCAKIPEGGSFTTFTVYLNKDTVPTFNSTGMGRVYLFFDPKNDPSDWERNELIDIHSLSDNRFMMLPRGDTKQQIYQTMLKVIKKFMQHKSLQITFIDPRPRNEIERATGRWEDITFNLGGLSGAIRGYQYRCLKFA
jgi:hypothetical protein